MRSDRLVRALLRLYPRAWRERYGDEFFALIAQSPVTPRVVVDVCLAALVERWHVATNWSALPRGLRSTVEFGFVIFAGWAIQKWARGLAWLLAERTLTAATAYAHPVRVIAPPIDDGAALFAFAILLACIGRGWRGAFPIAAPRQPLTLRAIVSIYLGVFTSFTLARYSDLVGTNMHPFQATQLLGGWFPPPATTILLFNLHAAWRRARGVSRAVSVW